MAHFEEFDGVLHECWSCGVRYWITKRLDEARRQDGGTFYCPNGHGAVFKNSTMAKLKAELDQTRHERDRLKQDTAWYEDIHRQQSEEIKGLKASRGKVRAELTRTRKRISHGTCPCCNRTFANLARHMSAKHPDIATLPTEAAA